MAPQTLDEKSQGAQVTDRSVPQTPVSPQDEPKEKSFGIQVTGRSVPQTPVSPQDDAAGKSADIGTTPLDLERQPPPSQAYHIFTRSKKLQIIYIVSAAAIFSPLSSNIYVPALGMISKVGWHSSITWRSSTDSIAL